MAASALSLFYSWQTYETSTVSLCRVSTIILQCRKKLTQMAEEKKRLRAKKDSYKKVPLDPEAQQDHVETNKAKLHKGEKRRRIDKHTPHEDLIEIGPIDQGYSTEVKSDNGGTN